MKYIEFNGIIFSDSSYYHFFNFKSGEGTTDYQSNIYIGQDGETPTNIRYASRIATITGDIVADTEEELNERRQQLFTRCNGKSKSKLVYFDGKNKYFAYAIADIPTMGDKHAYTQLYTVNFNLYGFYWLEFDKTIIPLFLREDVVAETFTLPCVFTRRVAGNVAVNETDFDIYPIIRINSSETETVDLVIKNETTGETIEIPDLALQKDDEVIINTEYLTAEHNGKSIINSTNDFSNWCLVSGTNEISIKNGEASAYLSVVMEFYKKKVGI